MTDHHPQSPDQSEAPADLLHIGTASIAVAMVVFAVVRWAHHAWNLPLCFGDAAGYLRWSHDLVDAPHYPSHMPGYPVMLALARWFTLGLVPSVWLPYVVSFVAWVVGMFAAGAILRELAGPLTASGTFTYAFFPVFGLQWTNLPYADSLAGALLCTAFLAAVRRRWLWWTLSTAAGLMVHQALYPFFFALGVACIFTRGLPWTLFAASGVPFLAYYVLEAVRVGDPNWLFSYHATSHLQSAAGFPLFEGILRPFTSASAFEWGKGALLLGCAAAAVLLSAVAIRRRDFLSLSLTIPVAMYAAISNEVISDIIARTSKFLVIPACVWASQSPVAQRWFQRPWLLPAVVTVGATSQLLWAAHIIRVWTSRP